MAGNKTDNEILKSWIELVTKKEALNEEIKERAPEIFRNAASANNWDRLTFILKGSEDIDLKIKDQDGINALINAARDGRRDIIALLRDKGVNINGIKTGYINTESGGLFSQNHIPASTALITAFYQRHWDVVNDLLTYPEIDISSLLGNADHTAEKIMFYAAMAKRWNVVEHLIDKKVNYNTDRFYLGGLLDAGSGSLFEYIATHSDPKVRIMLNSFLRIENILITKQGSGLWVDDTISSLIRSGDKEQHDIAKLLIEKCDDGLQNQHVSVALAEFALYGGNQDDVEWCIEKDATAAVPASTLMLKKITD